MTAEGQGPRPGNGSSGPEMGTLAYEFETAFHHHRAGRLDQAERRYRRILRRDPGNPEALNMMGVAAGQRGQPVAAVEFLRRAIQVDDQNPDYHYNLGMALQASRDIDAAIESYRRVIDLKADHADALKNLGGAYTQKRAYGDAESYCREAVRLAPNDAQAHNNLATVLLALGDFDGAAESAGRVLKLRPDYADAHSNLGAAHLGRDEFAEAEACFDAALRLNPKQAEALNNRGLTRLMEGNVEGSIASFREAFAARPTYVEARCNLGRAYRELAYSSEAVAVYQEADRSRPNHPKVLTGLAAALIDQGEIDAALECYDAMLARDPDSLPALTAKANLLQLKGATDACYEIVGPMVDKENPSPWMASLFASISGKIGRRDEAAPLLESLLSRDDLSREGRMTLHFALGKLLDANGKFDQAFQNYAEGNALQTRKFNRANFGVTIDRLTTVYSAENRPRLARATIASDLPVFIVGMPRSGTTLTEQILDGHPAVFGGGELDSIPRITYTAAGGPGNEGAYPDCVAELNSATLDGFVEEHLSDLRRRGGDARRVTDKMPYNFLHLGLISQLYPGARVVHCRRDPLDTCLSCYFQNFRRGNFQTYDLGHLGQYFVQYQRLMDYWREVLDVRILDVAYEDVVADLEGQSRRLVDFVGLEWDERCLRFYDSDRLVSTASYDQVRQPIYTRSVGRWRHYERHLGPLRAALDPVL